MLGFGTFITQLSQRDRGATLGADGGLALNFQTKSYVEAYPDTLSLDFVNNIYDEEERLMARTSNLANVATVSRATKAWYPGGWDFTSGGAITGSLTEYANNTARDGAQGLLVEESSTNQIRNPRGEGASGATPPTYWTGGFSDTTPSYSLATENGWPAVDVALSGGANNDSEFLFFEDVATVSAVQGDVVTLSVCARIVSGDLTGITRFDLQFNEHDSGGASLTNSTVGADGSEILTDLDGTWRRFFFTYTVQDASCASVRPLLRQRNASSNASSISLTLRIAAPQLEQKAYPTSPILPPASSPAASTRNADNIQVANGAWLADDAATIYVDWVPNVIGTATTRLFTIGDTTNGIDVYYRQADSRARVFSGGGATASILTPVPVAASLHRLAVGVAADNFALSVNGETQATDTSGAVPVGLGADSLAVAAGSGGTAEGSAYIKQIRYWPRRLSNAELEALVGN